MPQLTCDNSKFLHRKLEEQYSKVKAVLSDFTAWQNLPQREGLEKFSEVQASLSSIPSLCSGISLPSEHPLTPKISFEMAGLSDSLTFGQLGRLVLEDPSETGDGSSSSNIELEGNVPPHKKRKKL